MKNILFKFLKSLYFFNLQEGYSGDIEEEFLYIQKNEGKLKAYIWIWTQVFKSIPIFLKSYLYWSTIMLKNYFKLAYRSLFNKRIKEISVRKVLGAKTLSLMNLVNQQFLALLIISSMIATPLGYLMVKAIMDSVHHYHIPISMSQFVLTFLIILVTAVLTISSLLYRAANINPVETLKYE